MGGRRLRLSQNKNARLAPGIRTVSILRKVLLFLCRSRRGIRLGFGKLFPEELELAGDLCRVRLEFDGPRLALDRMRQIAHGVIAVRQRIEKTGFVRHAPQRFEITEAVAITAATSRIVRSWEGAAPREYAVSSLSESRLSRQRIR